MSERLLDLQCSSEAAAVASAPAVALAVAWWSSVPCTTLRASTTTTAHRVACVPTFLRTFACFSSYSSSHRIPLLLFLSSSSSVFAEWRVERKNRWRTTAVLCVALAASSSSGGWNSRGGILCYSFVCGVSRSCSLACVDVCSVIYAPGEIHHTNSSTNLSLSPRLV